MMDDKAFAIAERMLAGEIFYARLSPRLCPTIRDHMRSYGLRIQSESPRHESTFFYPLDREEFRKRLDELKKSRDSIRPQRKNLANSKLPQ